MSETNDSSKLGPATLENHPLADSELDAAAAANHSRCLTSKSHSNTPHRTRRVSPILRRSTGSMAGDAAPATDDPR
jgi:hypothetical protein